MLCLCCSSTLPFLYPVSVSLRHRNRRRNLHRPLLISATSSRPSSNKPSRFLPLPKKTDDAQVIPHMLLFDSIGLDFFSLAESNPQIVNTSLSDIKSTIDLLRSIGLSSKDIRRSIDICPEILTTTDITQVLTFLTREVGVDASKLRKVIHRQPRLLISDVSSRLRPTLYFLKILGVRNTAKYTSILTKDVEEKLIPRIDFFLCAGVGTRDARTMARNFPQLLCYDIEENLKPKFQFFEKETGRDLKELRKFPHYFAFDLSERIMPRHSICKERNLFFTLPTLLKPSDEGFRELLEEASSSAAVL